MSLDKTIPFTSTLGNRYLISFKIFSAEIPNVNLPIVDISLVLVESKTERVSYVDLIAISNIIFDYLNTNNVVLYYYCDTQEISRSLKNHNKSPQEFRSELFGKLFERKKTANIIKNEIVIHDEKNNDSHYISLISAVNNTKSLTQIENEIAKLNDK